MICSSREYSPDDGRKVTREWRSKTQQIHGGTVELSGKAPPFSESVSLDGWTTTVVVGVGRLSRSIKRRYHWRSKGEAL